MVVVVVCAGWCLWWILVFCVAGRFWKTAFGCRLSVRSICAKYDVTRVKRKTAEYTAVNKLLCEETYTELRKKH